MTTVSKMQMQCLACRSWFDSPFLFGDMATFEGAHMEGNRTNCPVCGKIVPCNKENIRFVRDDGKGGFVGADTTGSPGAQLHQGVFSNQTLTNKHILLDGSVIKGCELVDCTLVYAGSGAPIEIGECKISNPAFRLTGQAGKIFQGLAAFARDGFGPLLEPIFAEVLKGGDGTGPKVH